ncbi:tRNA dihydrouridine synthase [Fimbriimonas ginsengisoli]|uniref:tRNA-dihydrouridine synthase n=1 Tax=Fimbriimonas ginsengisoli Gsoil 348 TaxID=661478 RepID=A0A068NN21_FIMGI|nr:tRNA-dihydrouridine synthase family protein [Fimbriimonas ginsengisoli]AIE84861.1 dihydrouridine synthase DuS [Fimbriimonas ginsengisoli Gsoil 348]
MLNPDVPALVLAPMEGITDAPMRALQGTTGAFTYAVSEFLRVSGDALPRKVFHRDIPELLNGGFTPTGLPVQVQLLGGDPGRMAVSAFVAVQAGARAVDINFGCPAPTVNRHDGGASLLKHPERICEIVAAVRHAVPPEVPVSAKLRLGWDSIDPIMENAEMATKGGASWITIHARTRLQGYLPPVHWKSIGQVREALGIPVVANGDIWTLDDFRRCQEETGCRHFMLGRGALADPTLPVQIAHALGLGGATSDTAWLPLLRRLVTFTEQGSGQPSTYTVMKLKQWLKIAHLRGSFAYFHDIKQARTLDEFFDCLKEAMDRPPVTTSDGGNQ